MRGFKSAHFDVRKGNKSVCKFHERFGAFKVGETKDDFLYDIDEDNIIQSLHRYKRFLPNSIVFEEL
ncbi:hypothetical protein ECD227_1865 [Escherichia fergusonii ECD227]|nr:hypothetical protein ECD227_1865 [Escherichia fergusonii ECD227]